MKRKIRLEGVYDEHAIRRMQEKGISQYTFDFRPKSFNFLQQHRLENLLKELYTPLTRYYLHFAYEKNYVVFKFISDLKRLLGIKFNHQDGISLEFSDKKKATYYEEFQAPFYWHYDPTGDCENIFSLEWLEGIVFDFGLLEFFYKSGKIDEFSTNYYRFLQRSPLKERLQLILSIDWDSNIPPGLEEYFDFDIISLPINKKVEQEYRLVDYDLLSRNLKVICT